MLSFSALLGEVFAPPMTDGDTNALYDDTVGVKHKQSDSVFQAFSTNLLNVFSGLLTLNCPGLDEIFSFHPCGHVLCSSLCSMDCITGVLLSSGCRLVHPVGSDSRSSEVGGKERLGICSPAPLLWVQIAFLHGGPQLLSGGPLLEPLPSGNSSKGCLPSHSGTNCSPLLLVSGCPILTCH